MNTLRQAIPEEIGLEGLDGITLETLFLRLSKRLEFEIDEIIKIEVWKVVKKLKVVEFYEIAKDRPTPRLHERTFDVLPENLIKELEEDYMIYSFDPVDDENIKGSCKEFKTRKLINHSKLELLSLQEVLQKYNRKLVIVASQNLRNSLLISKNLGYEVELSNQSYCMLERVGRSRHFGESTAGPNSIGNFIKDSRNVHYLMTHHLFKKKLIRQQTITLKVKNKTTVNHLMHLPRYFVQHVVSKEDKLAEDILNHLKSKPGNVEKVNNLMCYTQLTRKSFICFIKRTSIFDYDPRYPLDKLEPDAKTDSTNKKEKTVSVVFLKADADKISELKVEDDENEGNDEFLDVTNQLMNVSIIRQVYQKIVDSGSVGITQQGLASYFGLSKLYARQIVNKLKSTRGIQFYLKDAGRQRHYMWITKEVAEAAKQGVNEQIDKFLDKSKDEEPTVVKDSKVVAKKAVVEEPKFLTYEKMMSSNHKVTVNVQKIACIPGYEGAVFKIRSKSKMSEKMMKRINKIVETVHESKVVEFNIMMSILKKTEQDMKEIICKKTFFKISSSIAAAKQIQIFMIQVNSDEKKINNFYFCDIDVKLDYDFWKEIVEQMSCMVSNDIPMPVIAQMIRQSELTKKNFEPAPKFAKMRFLHEFILYVMFDCKENQREIPIETQLEKWTQEHPEIENLSEIEPEVKYCYQSELNWKTFLKPLEKRETRDIDERWCTIIEIVYKLPIVFITKLSKFVSDQVKTSPELNQLVSHPIKCNYPLYFLPDSDRRLFISRKILYSAYEVCKRLCMIGLIKFGPMKNKEFAKTFIYINSRASLYNTTSSDAGYYEVSNKEYPKIEFNMNSLQDASDYWDKLYEISMNTKLNIRSALQNDSSNFEQCEVTTKLSLQIYTKSIEFEDGKKLDDGEVPGDRKGAGGLDRAFMSHLGRNWMSTVAKKKPTFREKMRKVITKKIVTQARMRQSKKLLRTGRYGKLSAKSKIIRKKVPKHLLHTDSIDVEIKKRDKSYRAKWSDSEDKTLILIRVALKFMFKDDHNTNINNSIIRDILHWKNEKSLFKTTLSCMRRTSVLMKKQACKERVLLYLEELGNNPETFLKYRNVSERVKEKYPEDKINEILKIAIVEFVIILHHMYYKQIGNPLSITDKTLELSNKMSEILAEFTIKCPANSSLKQFLEPNSKESIAVSTLQSAIMSVVHCFRENGNYAKQVLEVLQNVPPENVKSALMNLKRIGLISLSKRSKGKAYYVNTISTYYLSSRYLQTLSLYIPTSVFNEIHQVHEILKKEKRFQINFTSCGLIFLLAEMTKSKSLELSYEKADKLVTVDPNLKRMTNFGEISDNYIQVQAKKTEGKRNVKLLAGEANDESFIYNEDPIEWFLKIDSRYLHIFCILVNMKELEEVPIRNFELLETGWCSQETCIFQDEMNFETIIKDIAESFQIVMAEILDSKRESSNDTVITKSNFIKYFDNFMETNNDEDPRKDINPKHLMKKSEKVNTTRVFKKIIELGNAEPSEESWIMDYKKKSRKPDESICDDEDENSSDPLIHIKLSEKLKDFNVTNSARIQDSFVVNFSTIYATLQENSNLHLNSKTFDEIENDIRKFAIWSQSEIHMKQKVLESVNKKNRKIVDNLTSFLKSKHHDGATSEELSEKYSTQKTEIGGIIDMLLKEKEIARVGVNEMRFLYRKFLPPWLLDCCISNIDESTDEPMPKKAKIDGKQKMFIIAKPWIRVDGTVSSKVLNKLLGTILIHINLHPGIMLSNLCEKINIIKPTETRQLCEILEQIGCIELRSLQQAEVDLFSQFECQNDDKISHFTSHKDIFIRVNENAMQKFSNFAKIGEDDKINETTIELE